MKMDWFGGAVVAVALFAAATVGPAAAEGQKRTYDIAADDR